MNAKVVRLSDFRRRPAASAKPAVHRKAVQARLPLEAKDFAGQVAYWPESRIVEPAFDRILRLGGIQSIVDLRDLPSLGDGRSMHLRRCQAVERWRIRYVRMGSMLEEAERASLMPFEEPQRFRESLQPRDAETLRACWNQGAVLIIYPDDSRRLRVFHSALVSLKLASEDLPAALTGRSGLRLKA